MKASFLLLSAAAIWGFAFVAQRIGMEHVGPFAFNSIRFALGALVLIPLLRTRIAASIQAAACNVGWAAAIASGVPTGLALFAGASFQQVGIVYTTAGKAGFITGLYVILVPILGRLLGRRTGARAWFGAAAALVGLYFLTVTEVSGVNKGDLLVLCSALFWAIHVLLIGRFSARIGALRLAFVQYSTCSALSLVMTLFTEEPTLGGMSVALIPILYAGLFSVGIAYTLQVVAQRDAHPTHAAIILSLEAVFAVLGGWLVLGEIVSGRGIMGCGLMLAGMVLAQLDAHPSRRQAVVQVSQKGSYDS